jgi:hypothetical protein
VSLFLVYVPALPWLVYRAAKEKDTLYQHSAFGSWERTLWLEKQRN